MSEALILVAGEQWHAWRVSRRVLRTFLSVRREEPALSGIALYEQVLTRLKDILIEPPDLVLKHVQESFADWPNKGFVRLRDVCTTSFIPATSMPTLVLMVPGPICAEWLSL